jgi:hypothetical protein
MQSDDDEPKAQGGRSRPPRRAPGAIPVGEAGPQVVADHVIHADWLVTREDIQGWYAQHPDAFPGFDVAPIILNERRQAAADRVRSAWPDLPELVITEQVWENLDPHTSMVAGLEERLAAYHLLPAVPPPPVRRGAPPLAEGRVRAELEEALSRVSPGVTHAWPTRAEIAAAHVPPISVSTLGRRLNHHPHLRRLLPH